jgi:hypothetical protein
MSVVSLVLLLIASVVLTYHWRAALLLLAIAVVVIFTLACVQVVQPAPSPTQSRALDEARPVPDHIG